MNARRNYNIVLIIELPVSSSSWCVHSKTSTTCRSSSARALHDPVFQKIHKLCQSNKLGWCNPHPIHPLYCPVMLLFDILNICVWVCDDGGLHASCIFYVFTTVHDNQSTVVSLHHPFYNHVWPIVLLRNRPADRPRPTRLNTPDHVA